MSTAKDCSAEARFRRRHPPAPESLAFWSAFLMLAGGLLSHTGNFIARGGRLAAGSQRIRASSDLQSLSTSLRTYLLITGMLPTEAQGLMALVEKPTTAPVPKKWMQLCTQVPKDRWGYDYVYHPCPSEGPEAFDLLSKGPDGQEGTEDDIGYEVRSGRVGGRFVGPSYD